jgi:hypothetical protein
MQDSGINLLMQTNGLDNNQVAEARTIFRDTLSSKDMREGQAAFFGETQTAL